MKAKLFILLICLSGLANAQDYSNVPDGVPTANLQAYYPFDGNADNLVASNYNLVTINESGTTAQVNYQTTNSILGQYVEIDQFAMLTSNEFVGYFDSATNDEFTLNFWMKDASNTSGAQFKTYVELFESLFFRNTQDIGMAAPAFITGTIGAQNLSDWNFYSFVFRINPNNSNAGELLVYRDGQITNSFSFSSNEIARFNNFFSLGGGYSNGSPNWTQKSASIAFDEFYFYGRALSELEITQAYVAYSGGECPTGAVILNSQNELNTAAVLYQNCENFNEQLNINGLDISTMPIFANLKSTSNFNISSTNLTNLNGAFPALESVNGNFVIGNNPQLESIDDFAALQNTNLIKIENSGNLSSIAGFDALDEVGTFDLVNLPSLTDLDGFASLNRVQIFTLDNVGVTNLNGIAGLEIGQVNATGVPIIRVQNNPNLTEVSGLNYDALFGEFSCVNNASLISVSGVNNITRSTFRFNNNPVLTNMGDFSALTEIPNASLIPTPPSINNNSSLTALGDLSSLVNFGSQDFSISNNASLTDIDVFSSSDLQLTSISLFEISNNSNLSDCAIDAVCSLIDNSVNLNIAGNASGCADVAQVISACTLSNEEFTKADVLVYPNPFRSELTIQLPVDVTQAKIKLINLAGKIVYQNQMQSNQTQINNLASLEQGLYFLQVELVSGQQLIYKIIK